MRLNNIINLPILSDDRGSMVILEGQKFLPFDIKRVYYIFNAQHKSSRGFHAHKSLEQLAVCVSGNCRFILDSGTKRESVNLDSPTKGLIINKMIWREMHDFSSNCVLMVLASHHYDERDYIRDYDTFLKIAKK